MHDSVKMAIEEVYHERADDANIMLDLKDVLKPSRTIGSTADDYTRVLIALNLAVVISCPAAKIYAQTPEYLLSPSMCRQFEAKRAEMTLSTFVSCRYPRLFAPGHNLDSYNTISRSRTHSIP